MRNKYSKEDFELAVKTSNSVREILIKLGLEPKGGNYKVFYRNAKKFDVDVSSFINSTTYGIETEKRNCISDALLSQTITSKQSYLAVLIALGLTESGTNNRWLRTKVKKLNINTDHFTGQAHMKGKSYPSPLKIPLEKILVKDSLYASTSTLRKRLIKEGALLNVCGRHGCGIDSWQNEPIVLHLDHINGDNTDNRIENLRLLCPNCHSQTETYCGRNKK